MVCLCAGVRLGQLKTDSFLIMKGLQNTLSTLRLFRAMLMEMCTKVTTHANAIKAISINFSVIGS